MEFSRKEYQSGLPFSSPGGRPNPGIKPASPALAGGFFTTELPGKPRWKIFFKNGDKGIVHCKLGLPGPMQGVSGWAVLRGTSLAVRPLLYSGYWSEVCSSPCLGTLGGLARPGSHDHWPHPSIWICCEQEAMLRRAAARGKVASRDEIREAQYCPQDIPSNKPENNQWRVYNEGLYSIWIEGLSTEGSVELPRCEGVHSDEISKLLK